MKTCITRRVIVATACVALVSAMTMTVVGCGGSGALLQARYVVPLSVVTQYFASITEQDSAGKDSTAQGIPNATRAVFFINSANTLKVTITVDRYPTASEAGLAYNTALEKSERVPGFIPIPIPAIGQQSFAGSVTQGNETHVGLGSLDNIFVFGVTLAGFDATSDNVANIVALAQAEKATIDAVSGTNDPL